MSRPVENLTRADARRRAELLHDLSYHVAIDVTSTEHVLARSRIAFACREPGADTFVDVTAEHIDRAELNGEPIDLDGYEGTRLALTGLRAANELVIEARHAYSTEGTGVHTFVDPVDDERYLYTQAEPNHAHNIYACFDQPDLKATFVFEITAPRGWVVVSNSPQDGEIAAAGDDARTWRFVQTPVMSPYITAFCAGPYHEVRAAHGDIDLGVLCRRTLADHLEADEILEITRQGLDLFPRLFGMPYVWGKYDQVFVPEFAAGAMENAGCVTFNEAYIFRSKVTEADRLSRGEVILHEMAHMWFGDLTTMRWWDDLWLNESFATFTSFHALERATRFTNAWVSFNDELKAWAIYQDQMPTTHPIEADLPDVIAVHQNFDGITYAKGASVLRQLAAWVGEDAFFEGCAAYFHAHAYGNTTLEDFLTALEKASSRDLSGWADTWLRTAGVNTLGVEAELDGERYRRVVVKQTAPEDRPTLRPHRVGIGVFRLREGVLVRDASLELDVTGVETEVSALAGEPIADLLLPNDGDLAYAKIRFDEASLATLAGHLSDIDDALSRALCWSAAWYMLRDGELAARRFVDLVHANAHGETDVGTLSTLLGRARTATDFYGAPANRDAQAATMHAHARTSLEAAAAGSDHQLTWARHWAATARTEEQTREVRALLDGELRFEGLEIDTELAWQLLGVLVANDAADDERIEQQLQQDPTDLGRRHAARVRASRPDADAKRDAWRQVAEQDDLSHSVADAVARGWRQYRQDELLEPFVGHYFELLPRFWEERSVDRAIALTGLLYPLPVVDEATLRATDDALASGSLPEGAARELREQRDTLIRALRARDRDVAS